jgi:hypothetical protein
VSNKFSDPDKVIEEARKRFETTLAGSWVDILDYYPGPVQICKFYPDGTGYVCVSSGMGDDVNWFEWRNAGPLAIETRFTDSFSTYPGDDCEEEGGDEDGKVFDDGNGLWAKHRYDFKTVDYYGIQAVLIWTSGSAPWIALCSEDYYHYQGPLEGTAPGREHFMTPP